MEEHDENTNEPSIPDSNLGISRRTLLRRGAVVGGALVWAAPTIRTLGTPAFASGSPEPSGHDISYVAVVVRATDGSHYRAKGNVQTDGSFVWEGDPGPPWAEPDTGCYPTSYSTSERINGGLAGLTFTLDAFDHSKGTLQVPASISTPDGLKSVTTISASAFGGGTCQQVGKDSPFLSCSTGCNVAFDL